MCTLRLYKWARYLAEAAAFHNRVRDYKAPNRLCSTFYPILHSSINRKQSEFAFDN